MDADKFDDLVARLGDGTSRRNTVKGIVSGALAAVGVTSVASARNRTGKNHKNRDKNKDKDRDKNKDQDKGKGKDNGQGNDGPDAAKKKKCKKKGEQCTVKNRKKCCTKFCNAQGRCAKKPVS